MDKDINRGDIVVLIKQQLVLKAPKNINTEPLYKNKTL